MMTTLRTRAVLQVLLIHWVLLMHMRGHARAGDQLVILHERTPVVPYAVVSLSHASWIQDEWIVLAKHVVWRHQHQTILRLGLGHVTLLLLLLQLGLLVSCA